jgi:hypothetical protein
MIYCFPSGVEIYRKKKAESWEGRGIEKKSLIQINLRAGYWLIGCIAFYFILLNMSSTI